METKKANLITGGEGGPIALDVAASWTKNYRDKNPGQTISHFFGKTILEQMLAQPGCVGIRFYYANDNAGKKHLVITGVEGSGDDLITGNPLKVSAATNGVTDAASTDSGVGDQSTPCPGTPGCPKNMLSTGGL